MIEQKLLKCPNCKKKQLFPSTPPNNDVLNFDQWDQKWYFCGKCMSYFRESFLKEKGLI